MEPIMKLDFAQRLGMQTALNTLQQAQMQVQQAEAQMREVMSSLNLDPAMDYPMDAEGNVYPGTPKQEPERGG